MSSQSASPEDAQLAVVLVHPEIPPNTGNIGRLCAATRTPLHLVEPLGFSLEDRFLRRAGLDYWPHLRLRTHPSWRELVASQRTGRALYFSARAERSYLAAPYDAEGGVSLIFGCETRGLPPEILEEGGDDVYRIPILHREVRSLNLSNAVAVVLYEALRRRGAIA